MLITGASRGIGAQIALQYARAGASLSLVARTQAALDASKDAILREHPSARVLTSGETPIATEMLATSKLLIGQITPDNCQ